MPTTTLTVKLEGPTPSEPQSIFNLGQAFYLAGTRCALNIEVGPGVTQSLVSPAVVNFCFSIELFCKCLIQASGSKPQKIHKLDELFRAIPEEAREAITVGYTQKVLEPNLETLLEQAADYFRKVRYEYEFEVYAYFETPLAALALEAYSYAATALGKKSYIDHIRT